MADLVEFLWWCLTAPARLLSVLWPALLVLPLFVAALASVMRVVVLGRVDRTRVHPRLWSGPRWALTVGASTFVLVWAFVAAAVGILLVVGAGSS